MRLDADTCIRLYRDDGKEHGNYQVIRGYILGLVREFNGE